jgi:beta-1,4-mannooligosaccharide/beta-1,4-mannosyl-N-acetylglucosamine phosphorylase
VRESAWRKEQTMDVVGPLTSSPLITRHPANPILTAAQVPYQAALIFNAGVARYQGRYVMVFRNDYGSLAQQKLEGTNLGLAFSADGVSWEVQPQPCFDLRSDEILRAYDPRLTVLDGRCYMCFAVDTRHGLRAGIAVTEDFARFEILSLSAPDNRNVVLFPQRFGGRYVRLERPFPVYGRGGGEAFDIWISDSPDLAYWGRFELLLGGERVPFANAKIGPGAPPVKTSRGWLTTFHAVDIDPDRGKHGWEPKWTKRYCAGLMLLDRDDPYRVLGVCPDPLLAPEAAYEVDGGFRNNVIFPTGMVLEDSGEVKIYYGAADTVMCLATGDVEDLVALCLR